MFILGVFLGIMFGTGIGMVIMALMVSSSTYSDNVVKKENDYGMENSEELFPNNDIKK